MSMPWYGELPKRWALKRVGSLFYENMASNADLLSNIPMQFRFGEIIRKQVIDKDEAFLDNIRRYTVIQTNDIMVNGLNLNYDFITQRVAIVREEGCMTSAYISLRPKTSINPHFACYLLKAMDGQKILNGLGTGIRLTLGFSELKKTYLPLPLRDEQDQIVRYLDWKVSQINKLINAKRRQVALLQEQKRAAINYSVTNGLNYNMPKKDSGKDFIGKVPLDWKILRLKNITTNIIDCPHETPLYSGDGEYYVIRTADQELGLLRDSNQMYRLEEDEYKKRIRRSSLQKDDIVYGREGERWGFACLVPENDSYCLGQRMMQFRCDTQTVNPAFAMYTLNADYIRNQGVIDTFGSTSPHVNISTIRNYYLMIPDIIEQNAILAQLESKLTKINTLQKKIQSEIALFTEYRIRLISDVVTGKLDVRGIAVPKYEAIDESENDEPTDDETVSETEE